MRLSRGQVLMYLDLADLRRERAASMAGVAKTTFHRHLRRYRIQAPRSQCRLTRLDVAIIRDLYACGLRRADIARQFQVHQRTVDKILDGWTWWSV